jgi:hypothetical protein
MYQVREVRCVRWVLRSHASTACRTFDAARHLQKQPDMRSAQTLRVSLKYDVARWQWSSIACLRCTRVTRSALGR